MSQPDGTAPPTGEPIQTVKMVRVVMTDEQFIQHEQLEKDRMSRELRLKEDQHRSQHEYRVSQDCRELIKELAKRTTKCDGTIPKAVCDWIDEIELIRPEATGLHSHRETLMRVVIQTVSGSLRKEIEQYIQRIASNDIIDRYEVAWNAVKAHIRKTFLATNEEAYLRDEVETLEQSPYEPIASFNRRFRDDANAAYPEDTRNADQQRLLIKAYARGLEDEEIAKELMTRGKPKTALECLARTAEFDEYNDQYARLGRREKGMDLNVIDPKTRNSMPKTPEPDADENDIRALLERVVKGQDHLHTRLTKLEQKPPAHKPYKTPTSQPTHPHTFASTSYARTHNQSQTPPKLTFKHIRQDLADTTSTRLRRDKPAFNDKGEPRCFECDAYGHIGRDCYARRKRLQATRPLNA